MADYYSLIVLLILIQVFCFIADPHVSACVVIENPSPDASPTGKVAPSSAPDANDDLSSLGQPPPPPVQPEPKITVAKPLSDFAP